MDAFKDTNRFIRGCMFAIPISLALWIGIVWIITLIVKVIR